MGRVRGQTTSMDSYYDGGASLYNEPPMGYASYNGQPQQGGTSPVGAIAGLGGSYAAYKTLGLGGKMMLPSVAPVGAAPAAPTIVGANVLGGGSSTGLGTSVTVGGGQGLAPTAGLAPAIPLALAGAVALGDKWVPQVIAGPGKKIAQSIFGKGAQYGYNPKAQVKNDNRIGTQVKDWQGMSEAQRIKIMDDAKAIGALRFQGRDEESASPSVDFSRFFRNDFGPGKTTGNMFSGRGTARGVAINNGTYVPTREELASNMNMTAGARERYLKLYDEMQGGGSAPSSGNNKVAYTPAKPEVKRSMTRSPGIDLNGNRINYSNLSKAVAKKK